MTDRQTALAHYLGMEREAREDRAKELNATILDVALAANGLCERLESNYRETAGELDAQAMLREDPAYEAWLQEIDKHYSEEGK